MSDILNITLKIKRWFNTMKRSSMGQVPESTNIAYSGNNQMKEVRVTTDNGKLAY